MRWHLYKKRCVEFLGPLHICNIPVSRGPLLTAIVSGKIPGTGMHARIKSAGHNGHVIVPHTSLSS